MDAKPENITTSPDTTPSQRRKSFIFMNKELEMEALHELAQFRKDGFLCDITLKAYTGENLENQIDIPAHKIMLCAYSPYFRAMFSSNMIEASSSTVFMKEINGESLETLVNYMYDHSIEIDEFNVQHILSLANLLQITKVKEACAKFMRHLLEPENCLGIMTFAYGHCCPDLYKAAFSYALRYFLQISDLEEFLDISEENLECLLQDNSLVSSHEEAVYNALIKWINHDLSHRAKYFSRLFTYIRLPLLAKEFLCDVVFSEPLIKENGTCKDLLLEACKLIIKNDFSKAKLNWKPRYSQNTEPKIFIIGGQCPTTVSDVTLFNPSLDQWSAVQSLPECRSRCGVALLDQFLYVIGGFNGADRLDSVLAYHIERNMWIPMPQMNARRETLGVGTIGYAVYALGGFDGEYGLSSLEFYDPRQGFWETLMPMQQPRSSHAVAAIDNEIFAIGGYNGSTREFLNTVEIFDVRAGRWRQGNSLNNIRSGAGVSVLDGKVYVVGGHYGSMVLDTVEVWDDNEWKLETNLAVPRRNAGVASYGESIFVLGGDNGERYLDSIEFLNFDNWEVSQNMLPKPRSYAGIAVLS